jgi:glycerol-3-phosphate cytidylyltransferase-like family protein
VQTIQYGEYHEGNRFSQSLVEGFRFIDAILHNATKEDFARILLSYKIDVEISGAHFKNKNADDEFVVRKNGLRCFLVMQMIGSYAVACPII